MAKESSADAPVNPPAAVKPLAKPAQNSQQAGLSESAAAETQAVKPPAEATLAKEPPHLLTPLAALWPTATQPEPPRAPKTAVKPAAPQPVKVTFVLLEPGATQVFLSGEFNGWASDATPMKRDDAGSGWLTA
jgi:hypothetical protein